jgi:hypothetical protein
MTTDEALLAAARELAQCQRVFEEPFELESFCAGTVSANALVHQAAK